MHGSCTGQHRPRDPNGANEIRSTIWKPPLCWHLGGPAGGYNRTRALAKMGYNTSMGVLGKATGIAQGQRPEGQERIPL
jgi:hypothetical protein